MSRLPGDWAPPYPDGLDRLHERIVREQARRDSVRLSNVGQVQIDQDDDVFRIRAVLSGSEGPISCDFEPGTLKVHVLSPDDDTGPKPETTRLVTVPEDVSILKPYLKVEDGVLIVDLPKQGRGYSGTAQARAPRAFSSRSAEETV